MAANGNDNGIGQGQLRFTLSQVVQLLTIVALGAAAWGDLKGDVRVVRAEVTIVQAQHAEMLTRMRALETATASGPARVR